MDTHSTSSKNSTRYRAVGATSSVDESLFGSPTSGIQKHNASRRIVKAPVPPNAVVISADELMRIKNEAVIKTEAEIQADREQARILREEREKVARERKDRMKELEKKAAALAKKSDWEIADAAKKAAIKEMATSQVDMSHDAVKLLSSMGQRAIAFTIRDKQLLEKEKLKEIEQRSEKKMDVVMELD
eukprot:gene39900-48587_t